MLADSLGHKQDAHRYAERAKGYKHYYSKEYGTLRPILPDGRFLTPFDPKQGENFEPSPGFHEGNAWNYTFYVPHDIKGLTKLMGGKKKFLANLRSVFDSGNYDPANEPDIAYPYIFTQFPGEEWRTQELVARLLDKHFTDKPDGIPGNDDTGTHVGMGRILRDGNLPRHTRQPDIHAHRACLRQGYGQARPALLSAGRAGDRNGSRRSIGGYRRQASSGNEKPGTRRIGSITLGGKPVGHRIPHSDLTSRGPSASA